MLNTIQRWIVFVIFCAFAIACVGLEVYLVYSIVDKEFNNFKLVSVFLNGSVLYLCGRGFWQMISNNFLKSTVMPPERLHRYASERCSIIENARRSGEDVYMTRRNLITNTLKFSEECLRGWVAGSHFELCVFVDQEQPLLFAYFDSNHDVTARSMRDRDRNPHFYIENGYEVTKLLQAPTSQPRVLKDTHEASAKYVFTSQQQRKQLKSSVLLCLDLTTPCALVVSSNEKNAFEEGDPQVMSFIKYVGASVRCDLVDGDFLRHVRRLRPNLFN